VPHGPNGAEHGVTITGELLGVSEGKPYMSKADKTMHTPGIVDLLVGRYVERVEFNDSDDALAAVGEAKERESVTLKVRPVGPWDGTRWGRVAYRGRSAE